MNKFFLAVVGVLSLASVAGAQTVSLTINAGTLKDASGSNVVQNGSLLQLIASPTGTFSAPTSSSYVSGDNVVVASFDMNSSGGAGFTVRAFNSLALATANYTLSTGESLLLRFYPSLSFAGMPPAPTLLTTYGQVRSDTKEFGGSVDPIETGWFVPASSSTVNFDFYTASAGGTYANTLAYATGVVGVGVPEPSAVLFLVGIVLILIVMSRFKARACYGERKG